MSQVKQNITIKEEVLKAVGMTVDLQDDKGLPKYGITLDDVDRNSYNWQTMVNEEIIDALKYSVKENQRLNAELEEAKEENLRLRATMDRIYSTM